MVWMRRQESEQPSTYARRLATEGLMPFEIIGGVRREFELGLDEAMSLVVTDVELDIFLDAQVRRGLSRQGAVRLTTKYYGLPDAVAEIAVTRHGGFGNETR